MPFLTTPSGIFGYLGIGIGTGTGTGQPSLPSTSSLLVTWFDGTYGLTTSGWSNRGYNGTDATLSNVTIGSQNGLNCAIFTDTYSFGVYQATYPSSDSRTVFATYKINSPTAGQVYYLITSENTGFHWSLALYGGYGTGTGTGTDPPTSLQVISVNNGYTIMVYNPTYQSINYSNFMTLGAGYDATGSNANSYIVVNGSNYPVDYFTNAGLGSPDYQYLFGGGGAYYNVPMSYSGMTICEVLVYSEPVTPTEASTIMNYLTTKWGIGTGTGTGTGTGPNYTPPTNLNLSRNRRNFTCTWTAGDPAPDTYEIYLDYSNDQLNYTSYSGGNTYYNTTTITFTQVPTGYYYKFYVASWYTDTQTRVASESYSNVIYIP